MSRDASRGQDDDGTEENGETTDANHHRLPTGHAQHQAQHRCENSAHHRRDEADHPARGCHAIQDEADAGARWAAISGDDGRHVVMGRGGEVRRDDWCDLCVGVADARHAVDGAQVIHVRGADPTVRRQADHEVEGQHHSRNSQELIAERHRLRQKRQRDERHRQERQEHPAARERLVVRERSCTQKAPMLGAENRDHARILEGQDRCSYRGWLGIGHR
jgi:hypothetical protein